ncbi:MAG: hypothetical protein ACRC2R_21615, partial [Xenococcaceae cyanobacterium]
IFHWKRDVLDSRANWQIICDSVSTKLNEYFAQGNDPHSFNLLVTVESNVGIACLMGNKRDCSVMLFPIVMTKNYYQASKTLNNLILDDKFKGNWGKYREGAEPYIKIELFND